MRLNRLRPARQKTKQPVQFEITPGTRDSLQANLLNVNLAPQDYLFKSRNAVSPHLSTRQYARIVKGWVASIELFSYC